MFVFEIIESEPDFLISLTHKTKVMNMKHPPQYSERTEKNKDKEAGAKGSFMKWNTSYADGKWP